MLAVRPVSLFDLKAQAPLHSLKAPDMSATASSHFIGFPFVGPLRDVGFSFLLCPRVRPPVFPYKKSVLSCRMSPVRINFIGRRCGRLEFRRVYGI